MTRGLYRTQHENLVCRALATLQARIPVSFRCKEGWYEIITREPMTDDEALRYSQLASSAAGAGMKPMPLSAFKQEPGLGDEND